MISFFRIEWSSFVKPWFPFTKGRFVPSLFVLAQWFWRRFLNLVNVFPLFLLLSPPGKGHGPSVEQPWISFTCQVWLKLTLWFCRIRFLKILTLYFRYFVIIFPWKRTCSFIWANLEFPFPKEALCQVWLKLAHWSWGER